jgi:hypothetical protein
MRAKKIFTLKKIRIRRWLLHDFKNLAALRESLGHFSIVYQLKSGLFTRVHGGPNWVKNENSLKTLKSSFMCKNSFLANISTFSICESHLRQFKRLIRSPKSMQPSQ